MAALGLSVVGLSVSLTGCGQRGALYIPTSPAAAERATLVDTLTSQPKTAAPKPASSAAPATPTTAPAVVPAVTPAK